VWLSRGEERKELNLDRRNMKDRKEGRGVLDGINMINGIGDDRLLWWEFVIGGELAVGFALGIEVGGDEVGDGAVREDFHGFRRTVFVTNRYITDRIVDSIPPI
jgi:hypothetical protein